MSFPAPDEARRSRVWWVWVTMGVAPFLLPLLHHFLVSRHATGFLMYDCPYYVANGRAIFERGNGLLYPNPYDPSSAAPVIYFHWLVWLIGFPVAVLGLDPGYWFAAFTVAAAWLCGWATWRLVTVVLPDRRGTGPLFLLTVWGGGVLCLGGLIASIIHGNASLTKLFILDPATGWWFPNWGRNLVLPTEAIYHALVAVAYVGVLRRRWTVALGAVIALAATHPFSGAQHLLIMGTWCGILLVRERSGRALLRMGVIAVAAAGFVGYYFDYLPRYPEHRYLSSVWSNQWTIDAPFLLLASGPVALLAIWRLAWERRCRATGDEISPPIGAPASATVAPEWFFVLAGLITFALMKHDLVLPARQPAHFSRGYNWLPWWLLALPLVQRVAIAAWERRARVWPIIGLVCAAGLLVFDNAAFVIREWRHGEDTAYRLSPDAREMFHWMNEQRLRGVLVSDDAELGYLGATYTPARPFLGHFANTPAFKRRLAALREFFVNGTTGPWIEAVDYVLVERDRSQRRFALPGWKPLHENEGYVLLARPR